jgi:hypothetical protein
MMLTHSLVAMEGIGIALDLKSERMFITDLCGSAYSAYLDGPSQRARFMAQGNLAGIACAEVA